MKAGCFFSRGNSALKKVLYHCLVCNSLDKLKVGLSAGSLKAVQWLTVRAEERLISFH